MMDPAALQLAARLGGTILSGLHGGQGLLLVERLRGHGLPTVAVLGRGPEDLKEALAAATQVQAAGLDLNLLGLLPLTGCDLPVALESHRLRIGALVAALDAGLPWLGGKPMLPRRLPGCLFSASASELPPAHMGPLETQELKAFLPDWNDDQRHRTFRSPPWRKTEGGFETDLWPGVPIPERTELRVPPLELPSATPLADALRAALRSATGLAIPLLPLPEDPSPLHALRILTPDIAAFRGPVKAWELVLTGLSQLPAPPHFCARC